MGFIENRMNSLVYKLINDYYYIPHRNQVGEFMAHGNYRVLEKSSINEISIIKIYNGDVLNAENVRVEISRTVEIIKDRRIRRLKPVIFHFVIYSNDSFLIYKHIAEYFSETVTAENIPICISVYNMAAEYIGRSLYVINSTRSNFNNINNFIVNPDVTNIRTEDINHLLMNIMNNARNLSQTKKITATKVFIGINILFWILGLISQALIKYDVFKLLGMQNARMIILFGQYWRFITPIFLHADIVHMASNSYFLYICGEPVERYVGSFKFVILYLVTGIVGNIVSFFTLNPFANSLGASGACLGIGGVLVYLWLTKKSYFSRFYRGMTSMVIMIIINVFYGFTVPNSNIDNGAHVGGFLAGLLFAFILDKVNKLHK